MERNKAIQGLRGLGAITVFMWHAHWRMDFHFKIQLSDIFRGDFANVLFFLLAGFFCGIKGGSKDEKVLPFVRKKLKRIYPLYAVTVVAMLPYWLYDMWLAGGWDLGKQLLTVVVPHFLLIQSWIPGYAHATDLNGPGWFLSVLFFYWILTTTLLKLVKHIKKERLWIYTLIIFIIYVGGVYAFDECGLTGVLPGIVNPTNLCPFIIGILVAKEQENFKRHLPDWALVILLVILLILRKYYAKVISFVLLLPLLVLLVVKLYNNKGEWLRRFLSTDFLVLLGNCSMGVYLLHLPILVFLFRMQKYVSDYLGEIELVVITFIVTIGLANLVEKINSKLARAKQDKM